jgi:hypothetical protein
MVYAVDSGVFAGGFASCGVQKVVKSVVNRGGMRGECGELAGAFSSSKKAHIFQLYFYQT